MVEAHLRGRTSLHKLFQATWIAVELLQALVLLALQFTCNAHAHCSFPKLRDQAVSQIDGV